MATHKHACLSSSTHYTADDNAPCTNKHSWAPPTLMLLCAGLPSTPIELPALEGCGKAACCCAICNFAKEQKVRCPCAGTSPCAKGPAGLPVLPQGTLSGSALVLHAAAATLPSQSRSFPLGHVGHSASLHAKARQDEERHAKLQGPDAGS